MFQLIRGCHLIQLFQLFRCIIYLFIIRRCSFFSRGFNSNFVDHILSFLQMLSHADAPLNHSLLAIHLFWSAEDISEDSCFHY